MCEFSEVHAEFVPTGPPFEVVQDPPRGRFNATQLNWTKAQNTQEAGVEPKAEVAHIPFNRVAEFVEGEEANPDAPTNFKKVRTKSNKHGSLKYPFPGSFLRRTWYWCAYGPEDVRGVVRNMEDRSQKPKYGEGSRRSRGDMYGRGCQCNFAVKQLYQWPEVAEISYFQNRHVDIHGKPCHGILDESSKHSRAQYAPRLSKCMRQWVLRRLLDKSAPDEIMSQHNMNLALKKQANENYMPCRDDFLTKRDVLNISKKLESGTFILQENYGDILHSSSNGPQVPKVNPQKQQGDSSKIDLNKENVSTNGPITQSIEVKQDRQEQGLLMKPESRGTSQKLQIFKTLAEISKIVEASSNDLWREEALSLILELKSSLMNMQVCSSGSVGGSLDPFEKVDHSLNEGLQTTASINKGSLGKERKHPDDVKDFALESANVPALKRSRFSDHE
ncbi:hypothetical protein O6H91_18G014600 [Diphasiastrum complanatum]|uniref:Uncharacterized protein n=1 Tax=Diphasiastrum complanatum TaxID=34168 RepID=A0ACC2AY86_DIPCM|nr:hypothetical protein O6H91_18G014600 [Diphasiastrum complanatum]